MTAAPLRVFLTRLVRAQVLRDQTHVLASLQFSDLVSAAAIAGACAHVIAMPAHIRAQCGVDTVAGVQVRTL